MKLVAQRVQYAKVEVNHETVGSIGSGFLVFLGVGLNDSKKESEWLVNKLIHLRIFEDEHGKVNRSLLDTKGEVLVISQFTLYADCTKGRRPSFIEAASPKQAESLYHHFIDELRLKGCIVQTGIFGAEMKVSLLNDGPFTVIIDK